MIILDKHNTNNYIYITIEELRQSFNSNISLTASSNFSQSSFTASLPEDLSNYQDRYSKYNISSEVFSDYDEGLYTYKVVEDEDVLLTGTLKIIDTGGENELIELESEDDTYVVYENEN